MKNEKEFKKRISEMAAKIASPLKEEYEGGKINLPDSLKTRINSAVANQKDMAKFILDMINEIIAGEQSMANLESMSGWNSISTMLKRIAGESSASKKGGDTPDVSKSDMDKNALPDVDKLMETFNRINKK